MKEKRRNKKKLTTLIALLMCAILAFGIAGSLAYYTSVSGKITNIFYTSNDSDSGDDASVSITLSETIEDNNTGETVEEVDAGGSAKIDLLPNSDYTKEAIITVDDSSITCFVFLLLKDGVYDLAVRNIYVTDLYSDSKWERVAADEDEGYDLYLYEDTLDGGESVSFGVTVAVDGSLVDSSYIEEFDDAEIIFYSYAIQAEHVDEDTAIEMAVEYYGDLLGIDLETGVGQK